MSYTRVPLDAANPIPCLRRLLADPPRPPVPAAWERSDGGGGWIRTNEDVRRQIYSLLPLTTRQPLRGRMPPAAESQADKVFDPPCQSCCAVPGFRARFDARTSIKSRNRSRNIYALSENAAPDGKPVAPTSPGGIGAGLARQRRALALRPPHGDGGACQSRAALAAACRARRSGDRGAANRSLPPSPNAVAATAPRSSSSIATHFPRSCRRGQCIKGWPSKSSRCPNPTSTRCSGKSRPLPGDAS